VQKLVEELGKMRAAGGSNKALIFTQYNETLKYLAGKLSEAGFAYRTISGGMPMKQRAAAIEAFQKDPPTTARACDPSAALAFMCMAQSGVLVVAIVCRAALHFDRSSCSPCAAAGPC
jgi:hypothetical protein